MICTRCAGEGFLNMHQLPDGVSGIEEVQKWILENNDHDVQICDCCGDGENWYGEPGQHYKGEDRSVYAGHIAPCS